MPEPVSWDDLYNLGVGGGGAKPDNGINPTTDLPWNVQPDKGSPTGYTYLPTGEPVYKDGSPYTGGTKSNVTVNVAAPITWGPSQVDEDGSVTGIPGATYQKNSRGDVSILNKPKAGPVDNGINPTTDLPWGVYPEKSSPSGYVYAETGQPVYKDGSPYKGQGGSGGPPQELYPGNKWWNPATGRYETAPGYEPTGSSSNVSMSVPRITIGSSSSSGGGGGGSSSRYDPVEDALEKKAELDYQRKLLELKAEFREPNTVSPEGEASRAFQAQQRDIDRQREDAENARRFGMENTDRFLESISAVDPAKARAFQFANGLSQGGNIANRLSEGGNALSDQVNAASAMYLANIRGNYQPLYQQMAGLPAGAGVSTPPTSPPQGTSAPMGTDPRAAQPTPGAAPAPAPAAPASTNPLDMLSGDVQEASGYRVYGLTDGNWYDGQKVMSYDEAMNSLRQKAMAANPSAADRFFNNVYTDANGIQRFMNSAPDPIDMEALIAKYGLVAAQQIAAREQQGDMANPFGNINTLDQFNALAGTAGSEAAFNAMQKQTAEAAANSAMMNPVKPIPYGDDNIQREMMPPQGVQPIIGGMQPLPGLNRGGVANAGLAVVGEGGGRKPLGSSELLIDPTQDAQVIPLTSGRAQQLMARGLPGYNEGTYTDYLNTLDINPALRSQYEPGGAVYNSSLRGYQQWQQQPAQPAPQPALPSATPAGSSTPAATTPSTPPATAQPSATAPAAGSTQTPTPQSTGTTPAPNGIDSIVNTPSGMYQVPPVTAQQIQEIADWRAGQLDPMFAEIGPYSLSLADQGPDFYEGYLQNYQTARGIPARSFDNEINKWRLRGLSREAMVAGTGR